MEQKRCDWARSEQEIQYHDCEWGKPLHDDRCLFEMLVLEGMQAGLSWSTILGKREYMRSVFDNFSPEAVAAYGDDAIDAFMQDKGLIRNRKKLCAMVQNAGQVLRIQQEHGSFDRYIWSFVDHQPIVNMWSRTEQVPASDEYSQRMSRELKKQGFQFVGPTICYAFMQAVGMVNDHMTWCHQHAGCQQHAMYMELGRAAPSPAESATL